MTMMLSDFTTQTHAKWILAGEHAVLRNHSALVFPLKRLTLNLRFIADNNECRAEFHGLQGQAIQILFWSVLERGLSQLKVPLSDIRGQFIIDNQIPIAVGLGASAALCAAIARWFLAQNLVEHDDIFKFAVGLENLFHGESSGIDIAGAIADDGVLFQRSGQRQPLELKWQPCWYLSNSDQVGITANCVQKVKTLLEENPEQGARIDAEMQAAVELAVAALTQPKETGLAKLTQAINNAKICFSQWGLVGGKIEQTINHHLENGALAAKPTGSGDGGYILSLWPAPPPETLAEKMIAA